MKTLLSNIIASVHYYLAACLFYSGLARGHRRIHEFTMRELQRAADLGWTQAQVLFGQLLKYRGVTDVNKLAGVGYLRDSAAKGSMDAQFMLAEAIQDTGLIALPVSAQVSTDSNTQLDLDDPVKLYLSAAKAGHVMAALRLSKIFKQGALGQKVDEEQAQYWHEKFMKQGGQA